MKTATLLNDVDVDIPVNLLGELIPVSDLELPEFEWSEPISPDAPAQTLRDGGDNEGGAAADSGGTAVMDCRGELAGLDLPEFDLSGFPAATWESEAAVRNEIATASPDTSPIVGHCTFCGSPVATVAVAATEPATIPPEPPASTAPVVMSVPADSIPQPVQPVVSNPARRGKRQPKPDKADVGTFSKASEPLPGQKELPLPKAVVHPACTSTATPSGIAIHDPDAHQAWMEAAALDAFPDVPSDPEIGNQSNLRTYFIAGCTCALLKKDVTKNPFKRGSSPHGAWDAGWQFANNQPGECAECSREPDELSVGSEVVSGE